MTSASIPPPPQKGALPYYDDSKRSKEDVAVPVALAASKPNNLPDGKTTASAGAVRLAPSVENSHSIGIPSAAADDEGSSLSTTKTLEKMKAMKDTADAAELVRYLSERRISIGLEDARDFMREASASVENHESDAAELVGMLSQRGVIVRLEDAEAFMREAAASEEENDENHYTPPTRVSSASLDKYEQRRREKMKQNNDTNPRTQSNVEAVSDAVSDAVGADTVQEDEDQERTSSSDLVEADAEAVGATHIEGQAPQINRRFYLGLDRPSVIIRNTRARQERRARRRMSQTPVALEGDNDNGGEERIVQRHPTTADVAGDEEVPATTATQDGQDPPSESRSNQRNSIVGRFSMMMAHVSYNGEHLISATLVEEVDEEVVFAEPVGFFERKYKLFVFATGFLLIFIAIGIVRNQVFLGRDHDQQHVAGVRGELNCDPCIDRTTYTIKVLLNGYDPNVKILAWFARQSAKDMGVNLDIDYYIGKLSNKRMAADIISSVAYGSGVDALVVDITSRAVASAVRSAAETGMSVFGMNSGFEFASGPEGLVEDGSMLFFTTMGERLGGEMAASYFLQQFSRANVDVTGTSSVGLTSARENYARALFVAKNTSTYERIYQGYRDRLMEASNNTIEVEWFAPVKKSFDKLLTEKLSGCKYQSVLIGNSHHLGPVSDAIEESGCNRIKMGSFGFHPENGPLMARGKLDFVMNQNHHLHGWTAVQFATLYVTTGLVIAPPHGGVYLSGPTFMTKENYTEEILSICNKEDTNRTIDLPPDHECIHSNKISIGGVVHGTKTDKFWDTVFSAANQSAIDMGIELKFDRFEPQESDETVYKEMAATILRLCDGVDGLFVTIPDDVIVEAVMKCQKLNPNVQILSINTGYEKSKELNLLHHIGMVEKDAGYQAGRRMVKLATFNKALCWNHMPGISVVNDRCKGFEQAMNETGIEYLGQITVQESDISGPIPAAERAVNETGAWGGYGILLTGLTSLPAALELRKLHSSFVMGSFDTNSLLYDSLETGDVLFGMDQQPYLQGYLPISVLTHAVTSKQSLLDHSIKSGPRFIIAPPTDQESSCEDRHFPVCQMERESIVSPSLSLTGSSQPTSSMKPSVSPTIHPSSSMQPSSSPSFDQRPTLEIVQMRGHVRCGLRNASVISQEGFEVDLCRAVAAVLFGDPERFVGVPVTGSTRFQLLNDRVVDLLLYGDTHTIEREVKERSTGARFTFSSPFYYDGMAYLGLKTFVRCAEENERFGDCNSLLICATEGSTGVDFVQSSFPSDFVKVGSTIQESTEMLFNNTCNVFASDRSFLLNMISPSDDRELIVGDKLKTKEPLAIVTRENDHGFSDTINWVLHALFYGEEQGLRKNSSICQKYTNLTLDVLELNFMNAVYCVGNYEEVFAGDNSNRGMNQINNGTGMLYATPFGDLKYGEDDLRGVDAVGASSFLDDIRKKRSLNCGVVVPDGFSGEIRESDKLVGMNVDYCRTIAAALFYGDINLVKLTSFLNNDTNSFAALQNRTIDVLVGGRVEKKYDFVSSLSLGGFHFSSPYYLGNGTSSDDISVFSVTTREDDATFSSFVNCVVLATLYAQEKGVTKKKSEQIPLSPIFGSELNWALKDAIAYSGSYDGIYAKNFGDVAKENRGRNILNEYGTPQIRSFPGLSP